jgi:hypothetical protein
MPGNKNGAGEPNDVRRLVHAMPSAPMAAPPRERMSIEARSPIVRRQQAARRGSVARIGVSVFAGVATMLLLWSRLANLATPFWNDEAKTALTYSGGGPRSIFDGGRYVPNNHVLFSLATWVTRRTFGEFEAAYRLWSVVPALAAVGLVAWWARRSLGTATAVLVVGLAAVSPVHHVLAPQARGYGLAMLAGAGMLIGALRTERREWTGGMALFACSGLVGIWTLPVFVLPFVAQAAVLFTRPRLRRITALVVGVVGVASLAFYSPLLRAIVEESDQEFGDVLDWRDLVTAPYQHLFKPTIAVLLPDSIPWTRAMTVATVTSALAVLAITKLLRENRFLLMNLVVPIAVTYVAFFIARFYVTPRFASFLFFHVVVLLAVGGAVVWSSVSQWRGPRVAALVAALVAFVIGSHEVVRETRLQANQPWENSRMVAEIADATGIDRVYTNKGLLTLAYYLDDRRLSVLPKPESPWQYCFLPGDFIFVIVHGFEVEIPDLRCLRHVGGVRMDIPQQQNPPIGARGRLEIWIVQPPTPTAAN